jgi:hypothetical protein
LSTESKGSLGPNGMLYFSNLHFNIGIWSFPRDTASPQAAGLKRTSQNSILETRYSVSGDGRYLAYTVWDGKRQHLRGLNLNTGESRLLTPPGQSACCPYLSPDGRELAWLSDTEPPSLLTSPLTHFQPRKLAATARSIWDWSATQRAILYGSLFGKPWRVDLDSGSAAPFLTHGDDIVTQTQYSPDEHWIAFQVIRPGAPIRFSVRVAPLRNGLPVHPAEWPTVVPEGEISDKPRWNPNGNGIYFVSDRDGNLCIWEQKLDPATKRNIGQPTALRHFHDPRLSLSSVPLPVLNLEITSRHAFINLAETTGNIWQTQIDPANGS